MRVAAGLLAAALSLGTAQASPPGERPSNPPQSLEEMRFAIAWYGAACLLGASEVDLYGDVIRLEDVAVESGVSVDRIRAMAEARATEHDIAVDVLRRGGEPLRDPPEPFLTILRQAQADCQDWERARRVVERELSTRRFPDVSPTRATALRGEIDPLPFDFERRQRLTAVIRGIDEALAAGDFGADVEALLQAVSGRANLSLADIEEALPLYTALPGTNAAEALATDLLLPNPESFDGLTEAEVAEILARVSDDPQDPFGRYYMWLLLAHSDVLGDGASFVIIDETGEEQVEAPPPGPLPSCTRIAGSAAVACPLR